MLQRETFSKPERIKRPSEFQTVYRRGRKLVTRHFVLFFLQAEERSLGITVTKSVGKAAERNKIKRQIRELFRTRKDGWPMGKLIVKARNGSAEIDNSMLRGDLYRGVARLAEKPGRV